MLTSTVQRVRGNTAPQVNAQIDEATRGSIQRYRGRSAAEIRRRLAELDREWDVERIIELEAPLTIAAGVALGATTDRRWLGLSFFASAMVLLHALHGWYPLLPVLRRAGFRTYEEIESERNALHAQLERSRSGPSPAVAQ